MSEENKIELSQDELQKLIAEAVDKEVVGLKAKNEELLTEAKKYKGTLKEQEEAQRLKEEQRAKEQGEYKNLFEQKEKELEEFRASAEAYRQQVVAKEKEKAVLGIASQLSKDAARQDVLTRVLSESVSVGDDGQLSYNLNGVTVEQSQLIDHVKTTYAFAVDGSPASGDGVAKGVNGTAHASASGSEIAKKFPHLADLPLR